MNKDLGMIHIDDLTLKLLNFKEFKKKDKRYYLKKTH